MKEFNLNSFVYVKLNEKGKKIYNDYYNKIAGGIFASLNLHIPELNINKDGYAQFQMWEFMKIFGEHVGNGCNSPFDLNILFDEKDLNCVRG